MKNKITYIVDDDKLTVKLMTLLITKNNFCEEINSFYNGQLALDYLITHAHETAKLPDVILLDLNMPILDGWQFLEVFSTIALVKKIAVFILTSSIDPHDLEMAKKHALVKGYIVKPVTAHKLAEASNLISTF